MPGSSPFCSPAFSAPVRDNQQCWSQAVAGRDQADARPTEVTAARRASSSSRGGPGGDGGRARAGRGWSRSGRAAPRPRRRRRCGRGDRCGGWSAGGPRRHGARRPARPRTRRADSSRRVGRSPAARLSSAGARARRWRRRARAARELQARRPPGSAPRSRRRRVLQRRPRPTPARGRARTTGRTRRRDRCGRRRRRPRRSPDTLGVAGSVHVHQPAHRHDVGDRPGIVGRGHDVQRRDRRAGCLPRLLVAQHAQLVVGRRDEQDHGERPVVAAEGVEAHVSEITARIQDRRVEVLDALGKLEVAAVVDRSRIGRFAGRPRPAGWAAVATECVDHDVAANGIAVVQRDASGTRRAVLARQQPCHPDAGSDLDRRLGRRRAPERPLDDRSPDPEIHQVLVTGLPRSPELQRQVLRIRPSVQERVEDVRSPVRQQAPAAREERVRLEVVRDSRGARRRRHRRATRPGGRRSRSRTTASWPARATASEAASPATPPPATTNLICATYPGTGVRDKRLVRPRDAPPAVTGGLPIETEVTDRPQAPGAVECTAQDPGEPDIMIATPA